LRFLFVVITPLLHHFNRITSFFVDISNVENDCF